MSDSDNKPSGFAELGEQLLRIPAESQAWLEQLAEMPGAAKLDPLNVAEPMLALTSSLLKDPGRLVQSQLELAQDYWRLVNRAGQQILGVETQPVAEPEKGDRRFRHPDWEENPVFDFIKQWYLVTANWVIDQAESAQDMDDKTKRRSLFYTRQITDALAPTNFLLTNPEALRETVATRGDSVIRGLKNLLDDLDLEQGKLNLKMTDINAFKLGENIATTPGEIVYQNDLFQLIQYAPTTEEVLATPLLIFPPWINKYYILDLQQKNSFIKWAVDQGHTVLVVSWVNPDTSLSGKTWEDYLSEGILEAVGAACEATSAEQVHAIGYCVGGTLLGSALAYMAAKNDDRIKMATFFAAQVDFSEPGDLEVFIDEKQLESLDELMAEKGYLDSSHMATTFSMLRANDLIWSFFVHNYLLGKEPYPFDLLYWNADSTRMPRELHRFYLQNMYQENRLAQPSGLNLLGTPIDLRNVKIPIYLQASVDDHIAPYPSVFKAAKLYQGPVRFLLAGSGHIAGVINPPSAKKYFYRINDANPKDLEDWSAGATEHAGSWWPDWHDWSKSIAEETVAARRPGDGPFDIIEAAPGSYVQAR